jgi:hypothetical protein
MPMYTIIYTTYCILPSSEKFRKEQVRSMEKNREYSIFENDMNWRKRKRRLQQEADDFRSTPFS